LKATIRDSQTLKLIRPEDVQAYLSEREWNNLRRSGEYAFLYRRIIDDRKYDLLVPSTNEIDDFPQRIADIVRTLESAEDRSQLEIISDLASVRSDVVRIRPGSNKRWRQREPAGCGDRPHGHSPERRRCQFRLVA